MKRICKPIKAAILGRKSLLSLCLALLPIFALASVPEKREDYIKYLLLKKQAVLLNIKNVKTKNFIPQDVVWSQKEGPLMVPRPNPYVKVFIPEDPHADDHGIVLFPRIDKSEELEKLRFVRQELKRLGHAEVPAKP